MAVLPAGVSALRTTFSAEELRVVLASLFYKLEHVRSTQIELVLGENTDFEITHLKQGVDLTLVFKRNLGPNHFYRPFSLLHSVNKISSH